MISGDYDNQDHDQDEEINKDNLCNPFKHDLRCASLYGVDFVFKNERRERGRIFERVTKIIN